MNVVCLRQCLEKAEDGGLKKRCLTGWVPTGVINVMLLGFYCIINEVLGCLEHWKNISGKLLLKI